MTRTELIEYLQAAAAAENALYFCQSAQAELQQTITHNGDQPVPALPAYEQRSDYSTWWMIFGSVIYGTYIISYIVILIWALVDLWRTAASLWEKIATTVFAPIVNFLLAVVPTAAVGLLLLVLTPILWPLLIHSARKKSYAEYLPARQAAEREIIAVTKANASRTVLRRKLTHEIHQLSARAAAIQAILNNLYARNVLHVRFRNMMAVNQLLEYLEMGVCTELEGPNGAYAQYLNDLRTEKICGSIQQLEETMKQGFSSMAAMMGRLSAQLEQTNQHIDGLGRAISSDLARIERGITAHGAEMSAALSDIRAQAERIAGDTSSLAITAKTAAWNEYVTSLENGVRGYMLRKPQ